jgi:RHS repeat-associated protein
MVTQYEYGNGSTSDLDPIDGAAWRKPPADGITKDEYRTWSDWRGYPVVTIRKGDMQTLTTKVEHYFFRGMDGDAKPGGGTRAVKVTDSTGASFTDTDEFAGRELETITYNGSAVVSKSITLPKVWYTQTQTETWGTFKSSMVKTETTRDLTALAPDAQGNPVWREAKTVTSYDTTWGRPIQVDDEGDISTSVDDQCTKTAYADNAALYLYAYKKLVETFAVNCATSANRATQLLSSDRTSYDSGAYGVAPTKGSVTREEHLDADDGTTTTYLATTTIVDGFGRPTKVTDPRGFATDTLYTDTNGLNTQVKVTNALTHVTTTDYSPAFGLKTGVTDPNGKRVDMEYDGLGRLVRAWLPTRAKSLGYTPELKYTYTLRTDKPVVTKTETIRNDGTYKASYQLFDSFLRDRQTQAEGPNGGWLLTDTLYTPTGQKAVYNTNYLATGTPGDQVIVVPEGSVNGQTKYQYDGADRTIAEITAVAGDEKWRTTTSYGGDRTSIDPPAGGTPSMTVTDARGRTIERYQYKGASPTGPADVTRYAYTPDGKPKTVTGPDGAVWQYEYYQNGNKKKDIDPDAGTTTFTYDANGNLLSSVDSRPVTVSYVYDKLNRKTEEWQGAVTTGTKLATWTYDSYYKGQLAGTGRIVGTKTYYVTYPMRDGRYRPLKTSYIIPSDAGLELAKTYDFSTTYNVDGTTQTVGMPAGGDLAAESVTIGYDSLARPITLTGSTSYVTATSYADTGQILQETLSTGAGGKKVWQTFAYARGTNRLTGFRLDREAAPVVDIDSTYGYDDMGNVLSIADTPAGGARDIQCFTYDYLRRMTEAWSTASTATDPCAGGVAASGVGGPAAYHQKWTFRASGDRDTETLYSTSGGADTTRTYRYPAAGAAQPHTLRGIDQIAGATNTTFTYAPDPAGNMTDRTYAGQQQVLNWDADGHLGSVVQGGQTTSFVYDADGNRLVRKDPNATTLYLDGMELRLDLATRQVTGTRYYEFADHVIGVRSGAGMSFQAADAHDTAIASIDSVTGALSMRRAEPYGNTRGAPPASWPGSKGFVGGTVDAGIGLTHLNAREYDPSTGRFISVDPEFASDDPQSLGGYLYANNSPLSFSDPSGRGWGWLAVAVVAVVVVAVVVAIACPAVAPALIAAGQAAIEAGTFAAASGASAGGVALAAGVAGAAELSVAAGAAVGTGIVATGLTVAGAGGRLWSGTEDGPMFGGGGGPRRPNANGPKPKMAVPPKADPRGPIPDEIISVPVSRDKYPDYAQHVEDARDAGHPEVLTLERQYADDRREESTSPYPSRKNEGLERDEYPPANSKEGGKGASVRYIPESQNGGAGATVGNYLRRYPNGTRFRIDFF